MVSQIRGELRLMDFLKNNSQLLFSSITLKNLVSALKKITHSDLNANASVTTVPEKNWSVIGF